MSAPSGANSCRRRLVTSLLNPAAYPVSELSGIYHHRWTIETFYDEFKNDMSANRWHCKTVENFRKELACKLSPGPYSAN